MYYEVFEELRHDDGKGEVGPLSLLNKSFIDCFYEVRSEIRPIYDQDEDFRRLVGRNYPYLFYQKIISGISKAVFLGLDPWSLNGPTFLPSGRIKVPNAGLFFDMRHPCLYFRKDTGITYDSSSLKKWEDELLLQGDALNQKLNLSITKEGFRAHMYRVLEILYSMRSSSPRRRTNWTIFLHELLAQQKTFTLEELKERNFVVEDLPGGLIQVRDEAFPTLDYLEFKHSNSLGRINTADLALNMTMDLPDGDPKGAYTILNAQILGKLPLCHFYLNEHMFVGKEVHGLNAYYDYYVAPWTKEKDLQVVYLDNETGKKRSSSFADFPSHLKEIKYSILLGFFDCSSGEEVCYYCEPKMVKD